MSVLEYNLEVKPKKPNGNVKRPGITGTIDTTGYREAQSYRITLF